MVLPLALSPPLLQLCFPPAVLPTTVFLNGSWNHSLCHPLVFCVSFPADRRAQHFGLASAEFLDELGSVLLHNLGDILL